MSKEVRQKRMISAIELKGYRPEGEELAKGISTLGSKNGGPLRASWGPLYSLWPHFYLPLEGDS